MRKKKEPRKRLVYGVCLELKIGLEPTTCWLRKLARASKGPETGVFSPFRSLANPLWRSFLHCFRPPLFPCGSGCGSAGRQQTKGRCFKICGAVNKEKECPFRVIECWTNYDNRTCMSYSWTILSGSSKTLFHSAGRFNLSCWEYPNYY